MAQAFYLREQAERARRLARDSTDPELRDSLMRLADEYASRASAQESESASESASEEASGDANDDKVVWQARPDDDGEA